MPNLERARLEAFELLFAGNRSAVFSYFFGQLNDREEARDQTQETFVRVWSRIDQVMELATDRRRYWLFGVAKNVLIDCCRRRKVRESGLVRLQVDAMREAPPDPCAVAQRSLALSDLDRAIAALPDDRRLILTMTVIGGMTSEEIGGVLGRPAGTIRSVLHDARCRLRAAMWADCPL